MNPVPAHTTRAVKHPVFADFYARDLQKRFAVLDDRLLRRWERITKESLVEGPGQEVARG